MKLPTVLVTGATGFLGGRLVEVLIGRGYPVKAFAREKSNTAKIRTLAADICFGDARDIGSLQKAMEGVDVVIHAAADTRGDVRPEESTTVVGTRNALSAAAVKEVEQFIYISSCSVYGVSDCRASERIDEQGPLERYPEERGHYSHAKLKAEKLVLGEMNNAALNITCLRPGMIWGPGGEIFTPMLGLKLGDRLAGIIGSRGFVLPLVYLDNLVDAIIRCINHPGAFNQIFNVVDEEKVDKKTYTRKVLKPLFPGVFFFAVPYWALHILVGCQEVLCKMLKRSPFLTRYRLVSSQRPVIFDASKIAHQLGWAPPVDFNDAINELLRFEKSK
ncbi:MAG: NAD-dependent epimerase/dehydratase family protein [Desulfobacteraceae bacterium]|nr:NAD-dependent epimerase/dehydratase family protein [Desulfobacteraceae bacterium]